MATFYVLPPRAQVGRHFQDFLASLFPGQGWPTSDYPDLAEALAQAAESQPSVYVVFADDLDEAIGAEASVLRDFGAEPGDEIAIVRPQHIAALVEVQRRRVGSPRAA